MADPGICDGDRLLRSLFSFGKTVPVPSIVLPYGSMVSVSLRHLCRFSLHVLAVWSVYFTVFHGPGMSDGCREELGDIILKGLTGFSSMQSWAELASGGCLSDNSCLVDY